MIPKPKYTTYNIYIRDESEDLHVLQHFILNGLTIRIPIPDTTEKYRLPHELASYIETELQTYMLTEEERQQAKQEEKAAYDKGLADAWEAARKIMLRDDLGGYNYDAIHSMFGTANVQEILKHLSPTEVITKIKEYKEKQDEIKVGDEVFMNFDPNETGIVTHIYSNGRMYVMWNDGTSGEHDITSYKKTGRHFSQVEELLKAMKES